MTLATEARSESEPAGLPLRRVTQGVVLLVGTLS